MNRLAEGLEAALVRAAADLSLRLGPARASNAAGALARAVGPLLPVSRVADANLRAAMPELGAAARRRVIRGVWDNLGRNAGELPHLAHFRRTENGPGFEVENEAALAAYLAEPGAKVVVSAHFGNWEMLMPILGQIGFDASAIYRAASNPRVDAIIQGFRLPSLAPGVRMFPKGPRGARESLAHVLRGGSLAMLVDQKMNDGIAAPFFGRAAMTASAPARFARRVGCSIIPMHLKRVGPARSRLVIGAPIRYPYTEDATADILGLTTRINQEVEGWIREDPASWLWLHRRWGKETK